jgi:hypothetical protein
MIKLQQSEKKEIAELWNDGLSTTEIIERLNLNVGRRTVERVGAASGSWKQRWLGRMERLEKGKRNKSA